MEQFLHWKPGLEMLCTTRFYARTLEAFVQVLIYFTTIFSVIQYVFLCQCLRSWCLKVTFSKILCNDLNKLGHIVICQDIKTYMAERFAMIQTKEKVNHSVQRSK